MQSSAAAAADVVPQAAPLQSFLTEASNIQTAIQHSKSPIVLLKLATIPICAAAWFSIGHFVKFATTALVGKYKSPVLMYAIDLLQKYIPPTLVPKIQMGCFIVGYIIFLLYVNHLLQRLSNLRTRYIHLQSYTFPQREGELSHFFAEQWRNEDNLTTWQQGNPLANNAFQEQLLACCKKFEAKWDNVKRIFWDF